MDLFNKLSDDATKDKTNTSNDADKIQGDDKVKSSQMLKKLLQNYGIDLEKQMKENQEDGKNNSNKDKESNDGQADADRQSQVREKKTTSSRPLRKNKRPKRNLH